MNSPYSQKCRMLNDFFISGWYGCWWTWGEFTSSQQNCPKLQFLSQSWATQKLDSGNFMTFSPMTLFQLTMMIDEWWRMNDWWIMMHDEDDDESMMNVDERWINDKNMFGSWIMNDCMVESLHFFHGETRRFLGLHWAFMTTRCWKAGADKNKKSCWVKVVQMAFRSASKMLMLGSQQRVTPEANRRRTRHDFDILQLCCWMLNCLFWS